ncbi:MAG: hypothetical protein ACI8VC_001552 [Candidatus Endobugula sp.]|jgi:hypothetical protein
MLSIYSLDVVFDVASESPKNMQGNYAGCQSFNFARSLNAAWL